MRAMCSAGRPQMTLGIPGTTIATQPFATLNPGTTLAATTWEVRTSMPTATGSTCRTTAWSGRRPSPRTGLLIAPDGGYGSRIGDGRGSRTNLGDGHRIITDAGSSMANRGCGGRVHLMVITIIGRSGTP